MSEITNHDPADDIKEILADVWNRCISADEGYDKIDDAIRAAVEADRASRTALSDVDILEIWTGDPTHSRPVLGKNKVLAFARALLSHYGQPAASAEPVDPALAPHVDLLTYVLQDDVHNRLTPRVVDIAYTAFMAAKQPNTEDGGPSDWFNDTKPVVMRAISKLREDLFADRARSAAPVAAQAQPTSGYVQPVPDHCDRIVWRNQYYHLPIQPSGNPGELPGVGQSTEREALEEIADWMDSQADAQSKGGHATFDIMMLREMRDKARAALAQQPSGADHE